MNAIRKFLSDRLGPGTAKAASARMDAAAEDLEKTIRMNGKDFRAMVSLDKERLAAVNRAVKTAHFIPFSEICEYRGKVVSVCRNPQHPAKGTGIAMCSEGACPFMIEERKEPA